jgi:histidyl-tRNA synthetase
VTAGDEVKDIRSGDQVPADPSTWEPPDEDRGRPYRRTEQATTLEEQNRDPYP